MRGRQERREEKQKEGGRAEEGKLLCEGKREGERDEKDRRREGWRGEKEGRVWPGSVPILVL